MKTIFISTLFLLTSTTISAQNFEFDKEKAKATVDDQIKYLNLDEDKKTYFIKINEKYQLKLEDIRNSSKSRFEKFQDLKQLSKEKDDEIKTLLNKVEFKLYKKFQNQIRDKIPIN